MVDYRGIELGEMPDTLSILVYRLVQETLSNVARHAHAQHVRVSLQDGDELVRLSVEDDGQGFDPKTVSAGRPCENGHPLGNVHPSQTLIQMRERIELLGGQLDIASQPGHGTRIVIQLPHAFSA